jgi:hypothetical protein
MAQKSDSFRVGPFEDTPGEEATAVVDTNPIVKWARKRGVLKEDGPSTYDDAKQEQEEKKREAFAEQWKQEDGPATYMEDVRAGRAEPKGRARADAAATDYVARTEDMKFGFTGFKPVEERGWGAGLKPGHRNMDLDKGGVKYDGDKIRLDLFSPVAFFGTSGILTYGALKYRPRNWEVGMDWSRPFAAMLRHMMAFWLGEDTDPESGLLHVDHAACCIMFLQDYVRTHKEYDDRPTDETRLAVLRGIQSSVTAAIAALETAGDR